MLRIDNGIDLSGGRSEKATFWVVFGFMIIGIFVGQLIAAIATIAMAILNGLSMDEAMSDMNAIYDYLSLGEVLGGQALYTLFFTFLVPWFYLKFVANKSYKDLSINRSISPVMIAVTFLATFAFMFVNGYLAEWNQSWSFPEFMSGFEEWARTLEDELAETTEKFTNFQRFDQFLIGLIVISILPGIGEELLFRGVLQNSLHRWTRNHHIAIWVAAFLFSFIHFQFFGLVPRMVLGAIFGYLYVWSGNLWYPIIAHMTNNGVSVLLVYLSNIGVIEMDIDDAESVPIALTLFGLIAFIGFMIVFKRNFSSQKEIS